MLDILLGVISFVIITLPSLFSIFVLCVFIKFSLETDVPLSLKIVCIAGLVIFLVTSFIPMFSVVVLLLGGLI